MTTQAAREWATMSLRKHGLPSDSYFFGIIATAFDAGMIHVLQKLNSNPDINPAALQDMVDEFKPYYPKANRVSEANG
jgi:hypothetical protein